MTKWVFWLAFCGYKRDLAFVGRKFKKEREFTLYPVFYDAKRCTRNLNLGGFFDVWGASICSFLRILRYKNANLETLILWSKKCKIFLPDIKNSIIDEAVDSKHPPVEPTS